MQTHWKLPDKAMFLIIEHGLTVQYGGISPNHVGSVVRKLVGKRNLAVGKNLVNHTLSISSVMLCYDDREKLLKLLALPHTHTHTHTTTLEG